MSLTTQEAPKIEKFPVQGVNHVFLIDWDDNGILREVAVLKEHTTGQIDGILVDQLHPYDRKRLQRFIASVHSDKYQLWELLSQGKLNNGMNALDFFHLNYKRTKYPRGAIRGGSVASLATTINLASIQQDDGKIIGSSMSDPASAQIAETM